MPHQIITPPAIEPITLSEAKAHLRIESDYTDEDDLITSLIVVARQDVENQIGRALITQTISFQYDRFFCEFRPLFPPLQSVSSITYIDEDGTEQTLSTDIYKVDNVSNPARITTAYNKSYPATRCENGAVKIQAIVGYGDAAADVPEPIKQAIKLIIGHLYENREAVVAGRSLSEAPMAVKYLLSPYKDIRFV